MSTHTPVRFTRRDHASWAHIDRPESGNACDPEVIEALDRWLHAAPFEADVRVLVLTGTGRSFCAGADMGVGAMFLNDPAGLLAYVGLGRSFVDAFATSSLPTIAAVNGVALAGGFELVLAADFAIAGRSARLGDGHVAHGIVPGWGSSARLPPLVGPRAATYLLTTGAAVSADEFFAMGGLSAVVDDADLEGAVDALVAQLAAVPPSTLARVLRLARAGRVSAEALAAEWEALGEQLGDPEFRAGVERFLGRRPGRSASEAEATKS